MEPFALEADEGAVLETPAGNNLLPGPVAPEQLAALGRHNWVEFIGPPLAISDPLDP